MGWWCERRSGRRLAELGSFTRISLPENSASGSVRWPKSSRSRLDGGHQISPPAAHSAQTGGCIAVFTMLSAHHCGRPYHLV